MRLKSSLCLTLISATLGLAIPLAAVLHAAAQPATATPAEDDPPPADGPGTEVAAERTVTYTVTLPETGDDALDGAIGRASALEQLRERAPVDAYGLVSRAIAESGNMRDALRSEGYYAGSARITLDGVTADTPGLADQLAARTGDTPIPVAIAVEKGIQYKLAAVRLQAEPAGASLEDAGTSGLEEGSPARAQPILDAEGRMTTALRDAGHPFASLRRRVTVDHDRQRMEVTFLVTPGPRAQFANPSVTGEVRTHSDLLERMVAPLEGQQFSQEKIDQTRRDLLSLGVFNTVRARAADRLDESGRLPVTYTVIERPLHAVGFGAAYETRYGPTFNAYWEHRNLFGGAERLRLEAEVNRLGASGDATNTGGKVGANLRTPWFAGRNQTLTFDIAALRERPEAYDRDAFTLGALLERNLSPKLSWGAGPQLEFSRVTQDNVTTSYQLLGMLGTLRWTDTDSPLNPSRGTRATLLVNPIYSLGESNVFTRLRAQGSTYFDLSGDKGSILALRAAIGSIVGTSFGGVPPDKRFYSGGGGSVRGYDYQSVGPRTASNEPAGGLSQVEGSIELRQRVSGPWGMAAFLDVGSVTRDPTPTFSDLKMGAGLGVRYLTAIGPLRADIGVPLNKERGDSAFGLYIGIGQAF